MNYDVLNETEIETENDYNDLQDFISSLPDPSSNTNIPFDCANSDADSDIGVRSSNSSDSSDAYYDHGIIDGNSRSSGSDNRDHYTDAQSQSSSLDHDEQLTSRCVQQFEQVRVLQPMNDDDNSSGNTSQTSSTYFTTLPHAQSSSIDHDEQLPSRRVLQLSSNRMSQIVHDAPIRPTHSPDSHEEIEHYQDFESTSNDSLFSPPSTEICSPPSTENDDYLTCVYDV